MDGFMEELNNLLVDDFLIHDKKVTAIQKLVDRYYIPRLEASSRPDGVNGLEFLVENAIAGFATGEYGYEHACREVLDIVDTYCLRRPLFEDGEPVQFGDKLDSDIAHGEFRVNEIRFSHEELVFVWGYNVDTDENASLRCVPAGERVTRPAPKVLDADGVEINVGDTVYSEDGTKLIVRDIDEGDWEDGETPIWCGEEKWYGQNVRVPIHRLANQLFHEQPDSLERIIEDMTEQIAKWQGVSNGIMQKYERIRDRLCEIEGRQR